MIINFIVGDGNAGRGLKIDNIIVSEIYSTDEYKE